MTPAARTFIRSQASDIEHALFLPTRLLGLPPEEFIVLLLDTGARIGMHPRPLIFLTQRNALAALQRAAGTKDGFDCDAPGVQDFFGGSHDSAASAHAVKILLDEANQLLDQPVPSGCVLTIAKVRDELAAMLFRPAGETPSPSRNAD